MRNKLLKYYYVTKASELKDNVIGMKLVSKQGSESHMIYCVYLPPDNSKYGQENELVLDEIMISMYENAECDNIILCGDFNARVGKLNECLIEESDNILIRKVIDNTTNTQGQKFINFLSDTQCCIVNGRVTPEYNNFTSCTGYRGRAVVDYHVLRCNEIKHVKEMKVISCIDLINEQNWQYLLSDVYLVSDHNLLSMTLETSLVIREGLEDMTLGSKAIKQKKIARKTGEYYIKSVTVMRLVPLLLSKLEQTNEDDNNLDRYYLELTDLIINDATESTKNLGKRRKSTKIKGTSVEC